MFKRILPTVVAMLVGMVVLLSYFLPLDFLIQFRNLIVFPWATVLAAFALLVACLSVLRVHLTRLSRAKTNKITSLLILVSGVATFVLVVWQGAEGLWTQQLLQAVLAPGESALLALTAVTLVVAGMRVFRTRRTPSGVVFISTAVFILLTTIAYKVLYPNIIKLRQFVDAIAVSGMRGILMGVALGVTLTGLRIILGIDRPHSDES